MAMYKYCVAQVFMHGTDAVVSYQAFTPGPYGHHLASDIEDPAVLWYNTQEEAMKMRSNPGDCVVAVRTEDIPKYRGCWNEERLV